VFRHVPLPDAQQLERAATTAAALGTRPGARIRVARRCAAFSRNSKLAHCRRRRARRCALKDRTMRPRTLSRCTARRRLCKARPGDDPVHRRGAAGVLAALVTTLGAGASAGSYAASVSSLRSAPWRASCASPRTTTALSDLPLCNTQWHAVRIKCVFCDTTKGIALLWHRGRQRRGQARAAMLPGYLKILYMKDPNGTALADDVATSRRCPDGRIRITRNG